MQRVRFVIFLLMYLTVGSAASRGDELPTFWGLENGDQFSMLVTIVKQTEVTAGSEAVQVAETSDEMLIRYRVVEVRPDGQVTLVARVEQAARKTGGVSALSLQAAGSSVTSLRDAAILIHVGADGTATADESSDFRTLLAQFSGLDPDATQVLERSCPPEVILGWFSRPLWAAQKADNDRPFADRSEQISLGPFGILRCDLQAVRDDSSTADKPLIRLSGTGRFAPLVVPETIQSPGLLTNVQAELTEYSGRIHVEARGDDQTRRPPLDGLDVRVRCEGSGQRSRLGVVETVTFRQLQLQSWILTEYSMGRMDRLFNVPIPDDIEREAEP